MSTVESSARGRDANTAYLYERIAEGDHEHAEQPDSPHVMRRGTSRDPAQLVRGIIAARDDRTRTAHQVAASTDREDLPWAQPARSERLTLGRRAHLRGVDSTTHRSSSLTLVSAPRTPISHAHGYGPVRGVACCSRTGPGRVARAKAGMSQREVADAVHVVQSTIAHIESGIRQPSLPVLAENLGRRRLEMRITLEASDNHDDVLHAEDKRLRQTSARGGGQHKTTP